MSQITNNSKVRKEKLKNLLLELHNGGDPSAIREKQIGRAHV